MHRTTYTQICEEAGETKLINQENAIGVSKKHQIENALIELIVKERLPLQKLNSKYIAKLIDGTFQN